MSPSFDWQYHTDDASRLGHDIAVPRGRVIGGSSAVNAAVAMRARPSDFTRWARRGIEGWSWEEVLAAYKVMENTPTGEDAWHGRDGPFPIRQRTAEESSPSVRAFVASSEAVGLAHVPPKAPFTPSFIAMAWSSRSAARATAQPERLSQTVRLRMTCGAPISRASSSSVTVAIAIRSPSLITLRASSCCVKPSSSPANTSHLPPSSSCSPKRGAPQHAAAVLVHVRVRAICIMFASGELTRSATCCGRSHGLS